jgi:hypothetical protein
VILQLSPFPPFYWATDRVQSEPSDGGVDLVCIRTRAALPNVCACSWKKGACWTLQAQEVYQSPITPTIHYPFCMLAASNMALQKEMDLLDKVTVRRSRAECERGCLTGQSHARAVQCLREHGLLILRGVFTPDRSVPFDTSMRHLHIKPPLAACLPGAQPRLQIWIRPPSY